MKERNGDRKLTLSRQTVTHLSKTDLSNIRAGDCEPCWENLWTAYYCKVVYTKPTA